MSSTTELNPIFQNVGQAIHVAFLIMSVEAQQDSPLRMALIRILESIEVTGNHQEWLAQLRGTRSDSVDFGGLSSYDVRAQCALITLAVRTKLPQIETWVLQAKYGKTDFEDANGVRRFAFSPERIDAIKGLSEWLHQSFSEIPTLAMDCLVAKIFANHAKIEISFRDLAQSFGHSRMMYARVLPKIKSRVRELEDQAIQRLTPYFVQQGIVADLLETA